MGDWLDKNMGWFGGKAFNRDPTRHGCLQCVLIITLASAAILYPFIEAVL